MIELVGRILLIIPFFAIYHDFILINDKLTNLWLILLTFGLISLCFRVFVRLGLVYVLSFLIYYVINFSTHLELLWLVGALLILTSNINKRVEVIRVGSVAEIKPKPIREPEPVDPLSRYDREETFINWFLGTNNREKHPPVFYVLIYFVIFSPILILIIDRLVHY